MSYQMKVCTNKRCNFSGHTGNKYCGSCGNKLKLAPHESYPYRSVESGLKEYEVTVSVTAIVTAQNKSAARAKVIPPYIPGSTRKVSCDVLSRVEDVHSHPFRCATQGCSHVTDTKKSRCKGCMGHLWERREVKTRTKTTPRPVGTNLPKVRPLSKPIFD